MVTANKHLEWSFWLSTQAFITILDLIEACRGSLYSVFHIAFQKDLTKWYLPIIRGNRLGFLFEATSVAYRNLIEQSGPWTSDKLEDALWAVSSGGHEWAIPIFVDLGANINNALLRASSEGHVTAVRSLLMKEANINVENILDKQTPLHLAVSHEYVEIVKLLLENHADTSRRDTYNWAPLHLAVWKDSLEIVSLLLESGVDVTSKYFHGDSPLHAATEGGQLEMVKLLLDKGADVNVKNDRGLTPLHKAAQDGPLEIIRLLLDKWTDGVIPDSRSDTVVHTATSNIDLTVINKAFEKAAELTSNDDLQVVHMLFEKAAEVTARLETPFIPLHAATRGGNIELVKLMLEEGGGINVADMYGETSLMKAAEQGHLGIATLLLERGADIKMVNNGGKTTLCLAVHSKQIDLIKLLFSYGANINGSDPRCGTILNSLALYGYTDLLHIAYEQYNADKTLKEPQNRTPLHFAARGGHAETFFYLAQLGFDPTAADEKGDRPLSYACSSGSLIIINALLRDQVVPPPQYENWTPLHWACRSGHINVAEVLLNEGFCSKAVSTHSLFAPWDPLSIAIFHGVRGNSLDPRLVNPDTIQRIRGKLHDGYRCDGCEHVSQSSTSPIQYSTTCRRRLNSL